MRKALIPESRFGRYFFYAIGEIILVVIGILIALQVNNWNQRQKLKELELKYLKELKTNLEADQEDITHAIAYTQEKIRINTIVLSFLDKQIPYHDSLRYYLGNISGSLHFTGNTSAIEGLKVKGINLVSNDSLRRQISYLYDNIYAHIVYLETHDDHRYQYEILVPRIFETLKITRFLGNAEPVNIQQLLFNIQFRNVIAGNLWYRNYLLSQYRSQRQSTIELIEFINSEIQKFK